MTSKIDPDTELPIGPFKTDPASQEIRDEELLRTPQEEALWAGWSIDEEK
jgi:hypothetical protein